MGFGVSGSTAIIFLGVLVATGTLYSAAAGTAEQIAEAQEEDREDLLDRQNTEIGVTEVVYNDSESNLDITVTNMGTTTLSVEETSLLVDNALVQPDSTTVDEDGSTDVWAPDSSLVLHVSGIDQPDRVKVVAENGVAASNTTVEVS
ncbi:archaellum stator protein ArlF [Halobellus marinus]|uniref:fla cluster protein FlaF n=1 Tax=Halobellus TaxID=1073986 RepID=UPI0028A789EC|nr:fla cluster protein FlaF [Halobellus sp. DFY28]